jgi:hypothetical protein
MGQQMDERENAPPIMCVLEDAEGIVFFTRIDRIQSAALINIQSGPDISNNSRMRNIIALLEGLIYLEEILVRDGFEEWIFQSTSPAVSAFAHTVDVGEAGIVTAVFYGIRTKRPV